MYIKRKLESDILTYLKKPEIIAVVGPRQSGKTTLLKHIYEKVKTRAVFLTFEDRVVLNLFEHDTELFISKYVEQNKYIFIDEFQYAKHGGKILKYIFDTHSIKIIISGSSAVELTVKATKYLVGRILVLTLYPLDFEEFLSFKNKNCHKFYLKNQISLFGNISIYKLKTQKEIELKKYLEEFIRFGGYPRVVLSDSEKEKEEILKNINNTFFLREVKDILGLIDDYKLTKLITALATQIGSLIEYKELAQISGLSFLTIKKYINFLSKTFVCIFPKPFYKNKRVEIVKNPKVYFMDSGLRNSILDNFNKIDQRSDSGAVLENYFICQVTKQKINPLFWRTKKQHEMDFVLSVHSGRFLAVEIKKTLKQTVEHESSVKEFQKIHPEIPVLFGYFSLSPNFKNENAVKNIPLYLI